MLSLESVSNLDFLGPDYVKLFNKSGATAFQHPLWLHIQHQILVPAFTAKPVTIVGRDNRSGQIVLVLPLVKRRKNGIEILEFADFGVTDYCAPIIHKHHSRAIEQNYHLAAQFRTVVGNHDVLRFKAVRPEHEAAVRQLTGVEPQRPQTFAHELALNLPFEQLRLQKYGAKHRQNMNAARRALGKLPDVKFHRLTDGAAAQDAITKLAELRAGRFAGDPINQTAVRRFYEQVAKIGAKDGFALTHHLTSNDETIAVGFGIAHCGRFHGILVGCDYQRFGKCSPGLIAYESILADWCEAGGRIFDFNVGDNSYKQRFGTDAVPIFSFGRAKTIAGRIAGGAMAAKRQWGTANQRPGSNPKRILKPLANLSAR